MRDDQDRAGVALQIFLEPEQRFEVEVIGRLVQQQQVRLLRQQPGQVRAHDPAAAHLARGPVEILSRKLRPARICLALASSR